MTQQVNSPRLSPFEIAQIQFDEAADLLDLDAGMREVLRRPKRCLTVSLPVEMDDGSVRVFEGFRVQHNIARGPAKGGILPSRRHARRGQGARDVDDLEVQRDEPALRRRQGGHHL